MLDSSYTDFDEPGNFGLSDIVDLDRWFAGTFIEDTNNQNANVPLITKICQKNQSPTPI